MIYDLIDRLVRRVLNVSPRKPDECEQERQEPVEFLDFDEWFQAKEFGDPGA